MWRSSPWIFETGDRSKKERSRQGAQGYFRHSLRKYLSAPANLLLRTLRSGIPFGVQIIASSTQYYTTPPPGVSWWGPHPSSSSGLAHSISPFFLLIGGYLRYHSFLILLFTRI
ncbi:hypothetical protein PIB30_003710 [Stylosanthes scabra]|uniref:Uncharacterized protein n=1 Tax=Stylosanthes scabra TaxID=79078 RepID=A0ABU6Q390_9FABA|nr:hypothetical protein [Stylosanthes scabra]